MRDGRSVESLGDLQALWGSGAVATSSDADLLDQFVRRRGQSSDVAFEVLVVRHGPMVLGTCRRLLRDRHDVEDAFQATFLVFMKKAGSLRVGDSLGPWLHEVARRVSLDARTIVERRRSKEDPHADPSVIPGREAGPDDLRAVIDEEIGRLPAVFRKAIVLCDLEGLTIEVAASHLGWPAGTVRSRLARGRARLRDRLTRRGLAPSAGMVPMVGATPALVPSALVKTMIRCACNRADAGAASAAASALAEGVLMSMISGKMRMAYAVAALLGALGVGSLVARAQRPVAIEVRTVTGRPKITNAVLPVGPADPRTAVGYRMAGSVRVEGSGEPVPGAKVTVLIADSGEDKIRDSTTGADGRFLLALPPGQANAWTFFPPVGYWAPKNARSIENFVVSAAEPVHRKDYLVRRGVVWTFRVAIGGGGRPMRRVYVGANRLPDEIFRAEADDAGVARLTLPAEEGKTRVGISEGPGSMSFIQASFGWSSGFRPDAVKAMDRRAGLFHLTDEAGQVATIGEAAGIEPTLAEGKLVVRVTLPEPDPKLLGDLSGRVVDTDGQPIGGARVALSFHEKGGSAMSGDDRHRATTDAQGRYILRSILRQGPDGEPIRVAVVVTKEGYAGLDAPPSPLQPGENGSPQVAGDIALEKGFSLHGLVVDPDGRPAVGAWVSASGSYALRSQFTRTDENGRFLVCDMPKGLVSLSFNLGKLAEGGKYLADGVADEIKVKLRPFPASVAKPAIPVRPKTPELGQPAPELRVVGWTDGKDHTLADYRGKFVYLDFWGMWCSPCIQELPSLMRLKQKYEPRGLAFLSIHTPGEDLERIRRLLDLKKTSLLTALDGRRQGGDAPFNGETAELYGVYGYPTKVLIDREGKVAWKAAEDPREDIAAMKILGKEMGFTEATMTVEQFVQLQEAWIGRKIDKLLERQ